MGQICSQNLPQLESESPISTPTQNAILARGICARERRKQTERGYRWWWRRYTRRRETRRQTIDTTDLQAHRALYS